MNVNDINPDTMRQHVKDVFADSKKLRGYKLKHNPTAIDGLAAYAAARQAATNENFSQSELRKHFEDELSRYAPSILRLKVAAPPTIPEAWKDEVTGMIATNPWSNNDRESQNLLLRVSPELAEHLKRTANGVSYAYLNELRERKAAAERLNSVPYDAETHKRNPFVTGNRTEQNRLIQEDKVKAEVFRRESEAITLPWSPVVNRSILNKALVESPEIGAAMSVAADLASLWRQRELEEVQQQEQKARARAAELQQQAQKFSPSPKRMTGALR
jgi:hypothetical protein